MNETKISIIIPVYNVEKYIDRCLDSILNQSYENWECIIVNDGSSDNSAVICESYADRDKRFEVIHQKNAGVSSARNVGLEKVSGDVIIFVDSDDWLESDALETISINWDEKYDVIIYSFYDALGKDDKTQRKFFENDWIDFGHDEKYNIDLLERSMLTTYQECKKSFYSSSLLGKAYDAKAIQRYRFDEDIYLHEDTCFNIQFVRENRKVLYVNKPIYNYFLNMNSATTCSYKQNGERILKNEVAAYEFMSTIYKKENNCSNNFSDYLYLSVQTILCWTAFEKNKNIRKRGRDFCYSLSKEIIESSTMKRMPLVSKIVIYLVYMRLFVVVESIIRIKKRIVKR